MKLTNCENNQLVEATGMWFARSGGAINLKIKKVEILHEHEDSAGVMPKGFSKHKVSKKFYEKPLKGYYKK